MTSDRARKKAARARQAATGQPYMQAWRSVQGQAESAAEAAPAAWPGQNREAGSSFPPMAPKLVPALVDLGLDVGARAVVTSGRGAPGEDARFGRLGLAERAVAGPLPGPGGRAGTRGEQSQARNE